MLSIAEQAECSGVDDFMVDMVETDLLCAQGRLCFSPRLYMGIPSLRFIGAACVLCLRTVPAYCACVLCLWLCPMPYPLVSHDPVL